MGLPLRRPRVSTFLALGVLLVLGHTTAWASVPGSGTLKAEKDCEAFVSKKKKNNPDKTRLEVGDAYVILEVNRPEQPDWYRVRVEEANPPERWVQASCGTLTEGGPTTPPVVNDGSSEPPDSSRRGGGGGGLCSTPGLQDSFVLALSWQPAFCESHRSKKECGASFPTTFQSAGNFTLHGLWPNREACGTNYGDCEHRSKPREFCDYPDVGLDPEVAKALGQVMPGTASCLERHEWFKHGTCQQDWTPSEYFEEAMNLAQQFNDSGMSKYMALNMGKQIAREDFLAQVDNALGAGARERLHLGCAGGKLTDLSIALPAHIAAGSKLSELIQTTPPDFRSNCPARILIDAVGFSH
ncbi:ribonuclease T [Vitiosangium sp. GDMCC 1.1324]|uniref:ribonuclease T2 family protein n=1 Tax=Vitiosangium sp. (strain GDMCC 1.1324) TaxID=2138576 RepID=UPI000D363077|nr:ribonuclease T [Vitiosangium sp. GDMCC 1.1324]PTL76526.1 ribonuclease T [Vitiosangium sp. GDMCC 1.1324]